MNFFMVRSSPRILYSISDIFGAIGTVSDAVDTVADMFADTGKWIAEVLDTGLSIFTHLVSTGVGKLGTSVNSSVFSDFWGIVNFAASIFGVVGASMLVLVYIYRIYSEISDGRSEFNVWMFGKSLAALGLSVALVGNALPITMGIFNAAAALTRGLLSFANANGASFDLSSAVTLDDVTKDRLIYGVTGLKGMLLLLVALMAALVMIACGVIVMIEVYERIFVMFILMPFAGLSFSFYAAPDQRGHEIFSGYLKSVLATALEAVVIVLIIAMCQILISSGTTMANLFPSSDTDAKQVITIRNKSELYAICASYKYGYLNKDDMTDYCTWSDLSSQVLDLIEYDKNGKLKKDVSSAASLLGVGSIGMKRYKDTLITIDGTKMTGSSLNSYTYTELKASKFKKKTMVIYSELTWSSTLEIMMRLVFPCILCAYLVKKSEGISAKITGR